MLFKVDQRMAKHARKLGWLLIFAVIMLFLFPLHWGSFTQTHGPTTALRALMAAQSTFAAMALNASLAMCLIALSWISRTEAPALAETVSSSLLQLRC